MGSITTQNLLHIAGLAATHPDAAATLKKDIRLQAQTLLRDEPAPRLVLEIILDMLEDQGGSRATDHAAPIDLNGVRRRALSQLESGGARVLELIRAINRARHGAGLAGSRREAVWRIQEKLIENLANLPSRNTEAQTVMRERIDSAHRILARSPRDEAPSIMPFAGISAGATLDAVNLPRRPSGIPLLDTESLDGGLVAGTSAVIAGFTNVGKTYLAYHLLLEELFAGGAIMVVSLEDDTTLTRLRWYSYLLGKKAREIEQMTATEITGAFLEKYRDTPERLQALERIILWCPGTACAPCADEICRKIQEEETRHNLSITRFCVDYIQNIDDRPEPGETRTQRLVHAANKLYDFTSRAGKNMFLLSQARINADNTKGEFLEIHDAFAEATAIARNAHYILTLKVPPSEAERRLTSQDKRSKINLATKKTKLGKPHALFSIFNGQKWFFFNSNHEREQAWNLG